MKSLLIGASVVALVSVDAQAQTSAPTPTTAPVPAEARSTDTAQATQSADQTQPADRADRADTSRLEDIIVTATKVETTLQKTPQAIQTINGDALVRLGIDSPQQLNKLIGGLEVEQVGLSSSIFIRGVGSRVLAPTSDPAIAFSVDGVYYGRPYGTSAVFFDVARVEVVKGPQGTLYGRNATGGAVNVVTNRPVLGERSMTGEIEFGDYSTVRAVASINLPVTDTLAVRLAGQTEYHDGYLSDGADDNNIKALRGSVTFNPSDAIKIFASADFAHQGGTGPGAVPIGPGGNNNSLTTRYVNPTNPWTGPSDPAVNAFIHRATPATALPIPGGLFCVGVPLAPAPNPTGVPAIPTCSYPLGAADLTPTNYLNNDFYGANLTADVDVGIGTLTGVGGYRGSKIQSTFNTDSSPQHIHYKIDQYTGELRLASKPGSGFLKWLVGGFYSFEKQNVSSYNSLNNTSVPNPAPAPGSALPATRCISPLTAGPGGPVIPGLCITNANAQAGFGITDPDIESESYAAFGQATASLTSWLRLTGGVRYTHDRKSEANGLISAIYAVPAGVVVSYPSGGQVTFNNVSYRAGIEVDVAPRSMLYATYSTGFHAGGFQLGVRQGPNTYEYQPEEVKSYVVGIKNRFLDNRLQLNVEAFWLDYENYQQNVFGRINDGSTACSTLGIQVACPYTLRTENAAQARVRGIEADILFKPLRNTTINADILYNDAIFRSFTLVDAFSGVATSYAGKRIPGSNDLVVTGGINQGFPLGNGGRVVFDAHSQFKSGNYLWFVYTPANYQKSFTRTDLSLSYEVPGGHLSFTGYVRNVENHATLVQGAPFDQVTGAVWTSLNPPRTFGGIIGFRF